MSQESPYRPRLALVLWIAIGVAVGICLDRAILDRREPPGVAGSGPESGRVPAAKTGGGDENEEGAPAPDSTSVAAIQKLRELSQKRGLPQLDVYLDLVRELSTADCPEAMELFRWLSSEEEAVYMRAVARRWVALDFQGALEASVSPPFKLPFLLDEAAREWVRRDPEAALERLTRTSPPLLQFVLARSVLSELSEANPARAGGFLASNPQFGVDSDIFANLGRVWARKNPKEAIVWANSLPLGRNRSEALNGAYATWAEQDPAAVAAKIGADAGRPNDQLVRSVVESWSKSDPRAALAWIESLPGPSVRDAAWNNFRPDIQKLGTDAALELVNAIHSPTQRANIAGSFAGQLAEQDPRAALAWAERFNDAGLQQSMLRPILDRWSTREPVEAVSYVASLEAGDTRTELLRRSVLHWAEQDASSAFTWTQQLPAGNERDAVIAMTVRSFRDYNPTEAIQWINLMTEPNSRRDAVGEIAGSWARMNGSDAAQWLAKMPDANTQLQGHQAIARQWAFVDADATARWLGTLPSGASRDAAIAGYVATMDGYDPALATAWASSIEAPKERRQNTRSAFVRWLERDAGKANAWLTDAKIDDSLRAELNRAAQESSR